MQVRPTACNVPLLSPNLPAANATLLQTPGPQIIQTATGPQSVQTVTGPMLLQTNMPQVLQMTGVPSMPTSVPPQMQTATHQSILQSFQTTVPTTNKTVDQKTLQYLQYKILQNGALQIQPGQRNNNANQSLVGSLQPKTTSVQFTQHSQQTRGAPTTKTAINTSSTDVKNFNALGKRTDSEQAKLRAYYYNNCKKYEPKQDNAGTEKVPPGISNNPDEPDMSSKIPTMYASFMDSIIDLSDQQTPIQEQDRGADKRETKLSFRTSMQSHKMREEPQAGQLKDCFDYKSNNDSNEQFDRGKAISSHSEVAAIKTEETQATKGNGNSLDVEEEYTEWKNINETESDIKPSTSKITGIISSDLPVNSIQDGKQPPSELKEESESSIQSPRVRTRGQNNSSSLAFHENTEWINHQDSFTQTAYISSDNHSKNSGHRKRKLSSNISLNTFNSLDDWNAFMETGVRSTKEPDTEKLKIPKMEPLNSTEGKAKKRKLSGQPTTTEIDEVIVIDDMDDETKEKVCFGEERIKSCLGYSVSVPRPRKFDSNSEKVSCVHASTSEADKSKPADDTKRKADDIKETSSSGHVGAEVNKDSPLLVQLLESEPKYANIEKRTHAQPFTNLTGNEDHKRYEARRNTKNFDVKDEFRNYEKHDNVDSKTNISNLKPDGLIEADEAPIVIEDDVETAYCEDAFEDMKNDLRQMIDRPISDAQANRIMREISENSDKPVSEIRELILKLVQEIQ